jgi:MFS family permease
MTAERPTSVRWCVLGVTTLASVLLYLDRMCVSIAAESMRTEFGATKSQEAWFLGAFFLSYALFQVPSGMLSDRFGIRKMLVLYILAWSAFTGVMGLATSFAMLIVFRLGCGLAQAGAYPSAARAVRDWMPFTQRGLASSMVAFGGRIGGAIAPALTGWLMLSFALAQSSPAFRADELLDGPTFAKHLAGSANGDWRESVLDGCDAEFHEALIILAVQPNAPVDLDPVRWLALVNDANLAQHLAQHPVPPTDSASLEINRLLTDQTAGSPGAPTLDPRVNRRLWELLAPGAFKKLEARGWRPVMLIYGAAGAFVAAAFWLTFRETPRDHPWCNAGEQRLILGVATTGDVLPREPFPWRDVLTDLSMWGNCLSQVGTNIGWVFLVTWLPRYLDEVHHVPVVQRGMLASLPLFAGMPAMLLGGPWTDVFAQRLGLKWGRRLPIVITRTAAAMGYVLCLIVAAGVFGSFGSSLAVGVAVTGMCLVAVGTDLGVASSWAFAQDVGGRHTAAILGWGNMWGNLGAFIAPPLIYNQVLGESPTIGDWNLMFVVCAGAFVMAAIGALVMDASRPLDVADRLRVVAE